MRTHREVRGLCRPWPQLMGNSDAVRQARRTGPAQCLARLGNTLRLCHDFSMPPLFIHDFPRQEMTASTRRFSPVCRQRRTPAPPARNELQDQWRTCSLGYAGSRTPAMRVRAASHDAETRPARESPIRRTVAGLAMMQRPLAIRRGSCHPFASGRRERAACGPRLRKGAAGAWHGSRGCNERCAEGRASHDEPGCGHGGFACRCE